MKKLCVIGVLTLSSLCVLSAKTYEITVVHTSHVGNIELKPGQYTVKVQGANAIFTDTNDKTFTAPVKVEASDKKFGDTQVQSSKDGDTDKIEEIDLGDDVAARHLGFLPAGQMHYY